MLYRSIDWLWLYLALQFSFVDTRALERQPEEPLSSLELTPVNFEKFLKDFLYATVSEVPLTLLDFQLIVSYSWNLLASDIMVTYCFSCERHWPCTYAMHTSYQGYSFDDWLLPQELHK